MLSTTMGFLLLPQLGSLAAILSLATAAPPGPPSVHAHVAQTLVTAPAPPTTTTAGGSTIHNTVLTLQAPQDFECSAGATITSGAPFRLAIRSGSPSQSTVATLKAQLSPGVTVDAVSFNYRQCTGYALTGVGPTFTLSVAGSAAYNSGPIHGFPYNSTCPDGACYSPPVKVSASALGIKVPSDKGVQRIAFDFLNTGQNLQLLLPISITLTCSGGPCIKPPPPPPFPTSTVWHIVWTGGQSNAVGTNSQKSGYPVWATTDYIQSFCSYGNCMGKFVSAKVPLYNENNVGFSQTFANLLLPTLPKGHGIVLLNTGVGGTGFSDGNWVVPHGRLTQRSIEAMELLAAALPGTLGGSYNLHTMLWHQGEEDAADNRQGYHAPYCHYLQDDMGALVDYLRAQFPGASAGTPFLDGGMLPYWVDAVNGTAGVMDAIYALNTSRPCTGTADSRIFPDFFPGTKTPDGEPGHRSGVTGDVIHFNATQAVRMGYQYWDAYKRAVRVETAVPSAKTAACTKRAITPQAATKCTK